MTRAQWLTTLTAVLTLALTTRVAHGSGEWIETTLSAPGNQDVQKLGSAVSYLRRYSLMAVLSLAADDDDDGEASLPAKGQRGAQETRRSPSKPAQGSQPTPADPEREKALQEWASKIGKAGAKLTEMGARDRATEILARFQWRTDPAQAEQAYTALCEAGVEIRNTQEAQATPEPSQSDTVDAEFTPADAPDEPDPLTEGQRKALCAHANRAGAKTSEDRAALWAWALSASGPVGTTTLTEAQAGTLLDWAGQIADEQMAAALKAARESFPSPDAPLLTPPPAPFHPDADRGRA